MGQADWKPSHSHWGDAAHQETTQQFSGQFKKRVVGLCVWALASNPNRKLDDVELLAAQDPAIETTPNGKKVTAQAMTQARRILGLAPERRKPAKRPAGQDHDKGLSKIEKSILSRYQKSTQLVEDYTRLTEELASVQEAFEKARAALRDMPVEHAVTLADIDAETADILRVEGVLPEGQATGDSRLLPVALPPKTPASDGEDPIVVWPDDRP